jgi:hypothetical protein
MDYVFSKYKAASKQIADMRSQTASRSINQRSNMAATQSRFSGPWLARKFMGGIQCYIDHGIRYTIRHLIGKVDKRLKRGACKK